MGLMRCTGLDSRQWASSRCCRGSAPGRWCPRNSPSVCSTGRTGGRDTRRTAIAACRCKCSRLHPVHQHVGGKALEPQARREARIEVGVHVPDLDDRAPVAVHVREEFLAAGVVAALPHHVAVLVDRQAVPAPRPGTRRGLGGIVVQLVDAPHDFGPVHDAERLARGDLEDLCHIAAAGVARPGQERCRVERGDRLARPVGRDVQPPGELRSVGEDHAQGQLVRLFRAAPRHSPTGTGSRRRRPRGAPARSGRSCSSGIGVIEREARVQEVDVASNLQLARVRRLECVVAERDLPE